MTCRSIDRQFRRLIGYICTFFAFATLLCGCRTSTTVDEYRMASTTIATHESMVVLGRRHDMDKDTEHDFVECVGKSLTNSSSRLHVIPEADFVDALYPWFEASTAPMDVANLDRLIRNPAVAAKFKQYRIRYFIWIDGFTETTDSTGSITCAVGPGGGGCIGFKSWDDEANYAASIWDLKDVSVSGKIKTETSGTSYVPAVIIPIPLLARVKATACDAMADQLLSFVIGSG